MVTFGLLRLLCVLIFIGLLAGGLKNPIGWAIARLVQKTRPSSGYRNRYAKNPNASKSPGKNGKQDMHTPKSTTFGVKDTR